MDHVFSSFNGSSAPKIGHSSVFSTSLASARRQARVVRAHAGRQIHAEARPFAAVMQVSRLPAHLHPGAPGQAAQPPVCVPVIPAARHALHAQNQPYAQQKRAAAHQKAHQYVCVRVCRRVFQRLQRQQRPLGEYEVDASGSQVDGLACKTGARGCGASTSTPRMFSASSKNVNAAMPMAM